VKAVKELKQLVLSQKQKTQEKANQIEFLNKRITSMPLEKEERIVDLNKRLAQATVNNNLLK
jgi:hypothetical protein